MFLFFYGTRAFHSLGFRGAVATAVSCVSSLIRCVFFSVAGWSTEAACASSFAVLAVSRHANLGASSACLC